ncbi:MAG: phosphoribosylformylglycinamidine synthase, partial [Pseudomonadota bacterium]|nr:phosphoribosylformylglycinamidine synthase [Pseudomonadota bacterium]
MLQLAGPAAETAFRTSKLREQLRLCSSAIQDISVHFLHFIHAERPLDEAEQIVLDALLSYGAPVELVQGEYEVVVVPRLGTISPWASRATDIARNCDLPVHRLERGRAYCLKLHRSLSSTEFEEIFPLLHDRMTETVMTELPSESVLFAQHDPRPLNRIDLLREGESALSAANQELGLALSDDEIRYLAEQFGVLERDPTDVELM